MKIFRNLNWENLTHDTGDFKFAYLLHPPTGRGPIDIVFDVLSLVLLAIMWLLAIKLGSESMYIEEVEVTIATFFVMSNACRNIKTIKKNFRQVEIDWPMKVRYAHYLHSMGIIIPSIAIFATLFNTEELSLSLSIIMVVGVIAYALAMAFIFGISKFRV